MFFMEIRWEMYASFMDQCLKHIKGLITGNFYCWYSPYKYYFSAKLFLALSWLFSDLIHKSSVHLFIISKDKHTNRQKD